MMCCEALAVRVVAFNTFSRSRFFKCVSTKSRGSSTTTTNTEVMLFQTDACEVIEVVQFYLFHVLGHKKACEIWLFCNQSWNRSKWHAMSTGDDGSDGELKIVHFCCNKKFRWCTARAWLLIRNRSVSLSVATLPTGLSGMQWFQWTTRAIRATNRASVLIVMMQWQN